MRKSTVESKAKSISSELQTETTSRQPIDAPTGGSLTGDPFGIDSLGIDSLGIDSLPADSLCGNSVIAKPAAGSDSVSGTFKPYSSTSGRGFSLKAFSDDWPFLDRLGKVTQRILERTPGDPSSKSVESCPSGSSHNNTPIPDTSGAQTPRSRGGCHPSVQGHASPSSGKAWDDHLASLPSLSLADFARAGIRAVIQSDNLGERIILASDNADLTRSRQAAGDFDQTNLEPTKSDANTFDHSSSELTTSEPVRARSASVEAATPRAEGDRAESDATTEAAGGPEDSVVYRASELTHLLGLKSKDLKALHRVKRCFGVRLAETPSKGCSTQQRSAEAQEIPLTWLHATTESGHVRGATKQSS